MSAETPTPMSILGLCIESFGLKGTIKSEVQSPLFNILTQINAAAERGLDLLAISMTVALPDICSSLIAADGRSYGPSYRQWCAENLNTEYFSYVTPKDLYSIRCGVLHNGRFGDLGHTISRVVFVPNGGSTMVNCKAGDAWLYSTAEFCLNVNRAVVAWYEANKDHPNVQANIGRLMQYRDGIEGISMRVVA